MASLNNSPTICVRWKPPTMCTSLFDIDKNTDEKSKVSKCGRKLHYSDSVVYNVLGLNVSF